VSRRSIRLAVAGCLALALAVAAFAVFPEDEDADDRLPREFVGIVSEDVFAGDAAYRRSTLRRQRAAGIGLVRQTFDWSRIEKSPGRYDLAYYDEYVAELATHRMQLLPILFNPPPFRSSKPAEGARAGTYPPKDPRALGAFGAALARRYGPEGTLWRERPGLPRLPIRAWQVWNEPSLPAYWPSGPDPAEYTQLLMETGRAIKRVDRDAEIVTAGLPESRIGIPFARFLAGMYDAGARDAFDTLAIHSFARDERGAVAAVEGARELMDGRGDGEKKIWVTELGWATGGPDSPFTVGEEGQAERIARSLDALASGRRRLGVRGLVYFNWKDARPYAGGEDFWGLHTGLLEIDGRQKPGFIAFKRTTNRLLR
jgi:hypothetical protein